MAPNLVTRLGSLVLRRHWLILIIVAILATSLEVVEHSHYDRNLLEPDLIQEIFLIGFLIPVIAGLLLDELERAKKRARIDRANAVDAERYRLSRDVHDSLAQEVSYLHFKLDQLALNDGSLPYEEAHRQLEQMRDIAGQAYKEIYDMLALLRIPASATLPEVLRSHAERIGRRAHFEVTFTSAGSTCFLAPDVRQQLLYIYSEILSNVEKHAGAKHVDIRADWRPGEVTISVRDDGCGFNPRAVFPEHYGLTIMQERAHDMGGTLSIVSQPGAGAEARLLVRFDPCTADSAEQENEGWPAAETSWRALGR